MKRTLWTSLALSAAGLLLSAAVWSAVPSPMPIHWDAAGHPNGFASRAVGLLMVPAISAGLSAMMHIGTHKLPANVQRALGLTAAGTSAFMLAVHGLVIRAALTPGHGLAVGGVLALIGLLFAGLGYLMRDVEPNGLIGIRMPWTLTDEVTWKLTHRFAAKSMAIGGLVAVLAGSLLPRATGFAVGFVGLMAGALAPVVYSYGVSRMRR